jgi:hypothetical protein
MDVTGTTIGALVVDEQVLPITDLRLTGGKLQITAYARGPLPRIRVANYVVHGNDGIVVYRSSRDETTAIGPLNEDDSLTFTVDVEIAGRVAGPLGPVRIGPTITTGPG